MPEVSAESEKPAVVEATGLGSERIKHLELIQSVVARMANNSFLIKGWTLTIAAALFAVVASHPNSAVAAAGLVPLLVFWGLDGTFLRQERLFRRLYEDARQHETAVGLLSMDVAVYRPRETWRKAVTSLTLTLFYGTLVSVDVLLIALGASGT